MSQFRVGVEYLLSFGGYEGESETLRGRRRIMVGALWVITVLTTFKIIDDYRNGFTLIAHASVVVTVAGVAVIFGIRARPARFALLIHLLLGLVWGLLIFETTLFGGLLESGVVVIFGINAAVAAVLVSGAAAAVRWSGVAVVGFVYAVVISGRIEPTYVIADPSFDTAFNLLGTLLVTIAVLAYFQRQRDRFQQQSDDLLLNILPADIAVRLKADEYPIADRKPEVTVLFADIVGSTAVAEQLTPNELVTTLDGLFSSFDDIADEYGLEKIKTVGDNYFAVAGLTTNGKDHASAAADAALSMRDQLTRHHFPQIGPVHMRFGLHTGPVIAGVIGKHKFSYDLWGDTVNTASRMESTSEPDMIQVSQQVYDRLNAGYDLESRGSVRMKGKGDLTTYALLGKRTPPT